MNVNKEDDRSKYAKLLRIWIDKELVNHFKERCYRNGHSMTDVLYDFMKLYCK